MQLRDILLLRTSASLHSVSVGDKTIVHRTMCALPEAISAGEIDSTTDTSLFLTTYRGWSHLPADISPTYPEKNNPTAGTIASVPARDYFMVYKLHIYIEIQPNAFATELARIIIAKIGQRYLIMTTNIFFLRNAASPCLISSSMRSMPTTFDTNILVIMAAIGIITELVRKSKKSRNCMPMIFTIASGPYPRQDRRSKRDHDHSDNDCRSSLRLQSNLILKGRNCTFCQCNRTCHCSK